MSKLNQFFLGMGFIPSGIRLLKQNPGLLPYALVPFVIDILGFVVGVYYGSTLISDWVAWALEKIISPDSGIWYQLLYYPLLLVMWVVFLVLLGYLVVLIGTVIASPFHSLLAERALMKFGGLKQEDFKLLAWLKMSLKMLVVSLVKALVFAVIGILVFIMSFIPVVNLVGSFIASLLVAFDSMDYAFEAKGWDFKTRVRFFKSEIPLFSGMASLLGLTLLVPGLTLLFYPAAVVGASHLLSQSKKSIEGQ